MSLFCGEFIFCFKIIPKSLINLIGTYNANLFAVLFFFSQTFLFNSLQITLMNFSYNWTTTKVLHNIHENIPCVVSSHNEFWVFFLLYFFFSLYFCFSGRMKKLKFHISSHDIDSRDFFFLLASHWHKFFFFFYAPKELNKCKHHKLRISRFLHTQITWLKINFCVTLSRCNPWKTNFRVFFDILLLGGEHNGTHKTMTHTRYT